MDDLTISTVHTALRGLAQRQKVISNNIANVETPGYQARVVDFESSLIDALADGDPDSATSTISRSTGPTRLNGNNVAIDSEMTRLTDTELRHQLSINALNAKYRLLRTAITGM